MRILIPRVSYLALEIKVEITVDPPYLAVLHQMLFDIDSATLQLFAQCER